ncbi:MAG: SUMF1/EgtB/PvdO family nonheme iron enzyme, partial [Gammaproteobacteria bacterium]|nr:SUMF1/EgtB/PvdO family nonheme iron enzyme [Gammaproteobacteria bacterium]
TGSNRVIRGGSWYDMPEHCRSAYRDYWSVPDYCDSSVGFRLARTLP